MRSEREVDAGERSLGKVQTFVEESDVRPTKAAQTRRTLRSMWLELLLLGVLSYVFLFLRQWWQWMIHSQDRAYWKNYDEVQHHGLSEDNDVFSVPRVLRGRATASDAKEESTAVQRGPACVRESSKSRLCSCFSSTRAGAAVGVVVWLPELGWRLDSTTQEGELVMRVLVEPMNQAGFEVHWMHCLEAVEVGSYQDVVEEVFRHAETLHASGAPLFLGGHGAGAVVAMHVAGRQAELWGGLMFLHPGIPWTGELRRARSVLGLLPSGLAERVVRSRVLRTSLLPRHAWSQPLVSAEHVRKMTRNLFWTERLFDRGGHPLYTRPLPPSAMCELLALERDVREAVRLIHHLPCQMHIGEYDFLNVEWQDGFFQPGSDPAVPPGCAGTRACPAGEFFEGEHEDASFRAERLVWESARGNVLLDACAVEVGQAVIRFIEEHVDLHRLASTID